VLELSSIGAIPLLIGLVVFVLGVRKIHAARHATAPVRAMVAAAAAAGA
jgi:hypothetical protein